MIDQQIIKNVILDLGGVLVDVEPETTYAEFERILRPESFRQIISEELPEIVHAMETGSWSKERFKQTVLAHCNKGVSDSQVIDAWCDMILEFRAPRVKMTQDLGKKYKLYLLSNTNVYHVSYFENEFKNRFHFSIKKLFKKVYYSNEIGFRKPDPSAFEYVLNDSGLNAAETVLVDDRADNCETARKLGMQAIKVPEQSGLEAVIKQLI
ncbi:MAG: HAD family phosphatase [Prolixibacteraceae bacterium]|nr:HAD family phosphatase [Prolixibacteraceae bacterium]MBN2648959.1 HAD family phosphatase [Prolixibacteraceae bacterium]